MQLSHPRELADSWCKQPTAWVSVCLLLRRSQVKANRPQSHGHVCDEALNITEHACTLWHLVAWCGMMSFFVVHLVIGLMSGIYWWVVELAGVGGCRTLDAPRPFLFY